jgi:glycosyltransferase involved in cell wall biosynthesis
MSNASRPTICILQDNLYDPASNGWTGTHLQNFMVSRALMGQGLGVALVVAHTGSMPIPVPDLYGGIDVRQLRVGNRTPFIDGWRPMQELLEKIAPDYVYSRGRTWMSAAANAYAGRSGALSIWASNGEDGCEPWKFTGKLLRSRGNPLRRGAKIPFGLIEDILYARGIRGAGMIVNQTATQMASVKKEFGRDGIVIHSVQEVPEGPFVKDDPPVVLWVGQIVSEKRPGLFLKLAESLAGTGAIFRIIGRLSESSGVKQELDRLVASGTVEYPGPMGRNDVLEQMSRAALIVNTSAPGGDGIPNAMVEAWMREVPSLSFELDPDGLIRTYDIGLVAGGDFDRFTDGCRRLLQNRGSREEMGRRARQAAIQEFSASRNGARYLEVIQSIRPSAGAFEVIEGRLEQHAT